MNQFQNSLNNIVNKINNMSAEELHQWLLENKIVEDD